jgi:ribosomal protein S18 acetylase RimI-like enzyme
MQKFIVKEFSSEYLDKLIQLIHNTIITCYPQIFPPGVVNFFLKYHNEADILYKAKTGKVLIGLINNKVIASGYLIGNEIGGVYVHPDYQNQGFGKKIINELIRFAKKQNISILVLNSTPIAFNFYNSIGFSLSEELTEIVEDNSPLHYFKMQMILENDKL